MKKFFEVLFMGLIISLAIAVIVCFIFVIPVIIGHYFRDNYGDTIGIISMLVCLAVGVSTVAAAFVAMDSGEEEKQKSERESSERKRNMDEIFLKDEKYYQYYYRPFKYEIGFSALDYTIIDRRKDGFSELGIAAIDAYWIARAGNKMRHKVTQGFIDDLVCLEKHDTLTNCCMNNCRYK